MRGILGFVGLLAVIAVAPSMAQAQATKVTIKGGIVAKQPSDCDPLWACQLQAKVNDLAKRLDATEKENALQKATIAQHEKDIDNLRQTIKILSTTTADAVGGHDTAINGMVVKIFDDHQSILELQGTEMRYKTHIHSLPDGKVTSSPVKQ